MDWIHVARWRDTRNTKWTLVFNTKRGISWSAERLSGS